MKVKPVGTKQGLQWILNGVYQFRQNPLVWIILCGTLYAIIATLSVALELYGLLVFIILPRLNIRLTALNTATITIIKCASITCS